MASRHQLADGAGQPRGGIGEKLGRTADGRRQSCKHALLCRNHADIGVEPATQRLQWRPLLGERNRADRQAGRSLGGRPPGTAPLASGNDDRACLCRPPRPGHGLKACIRPAGAEHIPRRDKQPVAVSQRICARLAVCLFDPRFCFSCHSIAACHWLLQNGGILRIVQSVGRRDRSPGSTQAPPSKDTCVA